MSTFWQCSLAGVLAIQLLGLACRADDWPQWRGPQRDGIWRETGILERIPESGLTIRWRARVGNGYSGPAVAGGRVFVSDHLFNPERERVVCVSEQTGDQIWVHEYPTDYANMEYGNGPRATPTVHDGRVYTLGTQGHVRCLDAAKGELVWKRDLKAEFNAVIPQYGASAAPLVVDDVVILAAGGRPDACVLALDRHTGAEKWRALSDKVAYSAPKLITAGGTRQVIVWTADTITSLEPATGKVFWQVPRKATFDPAEAVADPVLFNNKLLCLAAWSRSSLLLQLESDRSAASVIWKSRQKPTTFIATPVFQDDRYFYASQGDGHLACLDATNGNEVWVSQEPTGKRLGTVHLTPHQDRVFLFNQVGNLILAKLSPQGYQELGRTLLVEPTAGYRAQGPITWAHPAYANQHVYARNDRELVSASLAADQPRDEGKPGLTFKSRALSNPAQAETASVLAFDPNGRSLATGSWHGSVKLIDPANGKELAELPRFRDSVSAVAFSRNGRFLVAAGGSEFTPARNAGKTTGQVKLWDADTRQEIAELAGHTSIVFTAVFSPDSQTLATGSADHSVRLWEAATGKEKLVLSGHTEAVRSVAFSPDGALLASASTDKSVILWDTRTGEQQATLNGHEDEVRCVAFSPGGELLASGSADWTIRVWNVATGQPRQVLKGHQGSVTALVFYHNQAVLSGSGDQTLKLWSLAAGQTFATLRGHRSSITSVVLSPDEKTLVSAGVDDPVRAWDLMPSTLMEWQR